MAEVVPLETAHFLGPTADAPVSYNRKDLCTCAAGIGCTEMKFLYEADPGFAPFPSFAVSLLFKGDSTDAHRMPSLAMQAAGLSNDLLFYPSREFGVRTGLDAERCIERVRSLPRNGTRLMLSTRHVGMHRKGRGVLSESESELRGAEDGAVYYRFTSAAFGTGKAVALFRDSGISHAESLPVPERPPDCVDELQTLPNQSHIYRLTGDFNNLHIDPAVARKLGFEQPILHGMCTLGFACRSLLRLWCGNDEERFSRIKVRLVAPVLPGQTLVTEMWRDEGNERRVLFRTLAKETGQVVLSNCFFEATEPLGPPLPSLSRGGSKL